MFEVGAVTRFRAFHRMPGEAPPENERHPHDYRVEVVAERERLDERGMVINLDVLTGALADVAERVREHDLSEVCGTEAVTVEVLSAWIHEQLAATLRDNGAEAVAVRAWESEEAFGGVRARV
jgi:6-pyruvoyltetrahydropterin/6-carboxytetrahydropterin synthase